MWADVWMMLVLAALSSVLPAAMLAVRAMTLLRSDGGGAAGHQQRTKSKCEHLALHQSLPRSAPSGGTILQDDGGSMMSAQHWPWGAAVAALLLAVFSGLAENRRAGRDQLDRIGWVPWRGLQIGGLFAAIALVLIALHK
jgi:hypothetical protein